MDPHRRPGIPLREGSRRAGVINVDMGHHDMREVPSGDPDPVQGLGHHRQIGAGAGFDQCGFRAGEDIDGVQLALTHHAGVHPDDALACLEQDRRAGRGTHDDGSLLLLVSPARRAVRPCRTPWRRAA